MLSTITSTDVARAAGVSPRTAQTLLKAQLDLPPGQKWRFPAHQLPELVQQVVAARKRRRKNCFNSPKPARTHHANA